MFNRGKENLGLTIAAMAPVTTSTASRDAYYLKLALRACAWYTSGTYHHCGHLPSRLPSHLKH